MKQIMTFALESIFEYAKATPKSRNNIKGNDKVISVFIVFVHAILKTKERIQLFSFILQSSPTSNDSHKINVYILLFCD